MRRVDRADDLTSALVAVSDEDPERLDAVDVESILFSLSLAGHETTTGLIAHTVHRLLGTEPARGRSVRYRDRHLTTRAHVRDTESLSGTRKSRAPANGRADGRTNGSLSACR